MLYIAHCQLGNCQLLKLVFFRIDITHIRQFRHVVQKDT
jgi:hypothetical protein